MKVKIIAKPNIEELELSINDFIKMTHVINISLTYVPKAIIAVVLYE